MTKFEHKEDRFEDLFASAESMYQVKSLAIIEYKDEGLVEFNRLREQRLQTLPLDLLATTPTTTKSSEPEQQRNKKPPITPKQQEEVHSQRQEVTQENEQRQEETQAKLHRQEETQAKVQEQSNLKINEDTQIDPKLIQEWQRFNSIIGNL